MTDFSPEAIREREAICSEGGDFRRNHMPAPNFPSADMDIAYLLSANEALAAALEQCRQACLFTDGDGRIGVTTDPHIDEQLFDELCAALRQHRGEKT